MAENQKEPLCTVNELLGFGLLCLVYGAILFSMDPEWVAWAAPLAFGGALYASEPPPASAHLGSPQGVIVAAYLYGVLSLLAIALLPLALAKRRSTWLSWLKAESECGSIARLRSFLRSKRMLTPGR
jgi:hypothetical protein